MKTALKLVAIPASLSAPALLGPHGGAARAASWCPAGLRCPATGEPALCAAGAYCAAGVATPCPPPWSCPAGAASPRGVGIRDSSAEVGAFATPAVDVPADAPGPAFLPVGRPALRRGTQLRSGKDSDLCLHVEEAKDLARASLTPCDPDSPEQVFYMDDAGKIRTRKSAKLCLEMDPSSESWGGVFVHSLCLDTWEVLDSGALRNVGDDKCLGVRFSSSGTTAERLPCPMDGTPQHPQTLWGDVTPSLSGDPAPFKYDRCSGPDFSSCVYVASDARPSTIANGHGFLKESLGRDRDVLGLEEWDSQRIPRDGVWDFEIAVCPAEGSGPAIAPNRSDAPDSAPLPTCYLIANRHSGHLLFAKSGMEDAEGVGSGVPGDDVADEMKWIIAEDPACEGQYCFAITNAFSGRALRSLDNLFALPNVGASTSVPQGADADAWRVQRSQLHLEAENAGALLLQQDVACGPADGALTSFKMQTTTRRMHHSFGCDGDFAREFAPAASNRTLVRGDNPMDGGTWECLEPGRVLSGIATRRAPDGAWSALSTCADAGANTDVCEDVTTDPVPLYLEGRRSPNPLTHLSKLPVECRVGQALRTVSLENDGLSARYVYRCCEITRENPGSSAPQQLALDRLTAVTHTVSACGARHAWILPEQIHEDGRSHNPAKFSDRISVLLGRLESVIAGIDDGFQLIEVTDVLREEHRKLGQASTIREAIDVAESVEEVVSGRCPSEPLFRWKRAASGTSIETQLEFGLTSEWAQGDFEEFLEGVTESRAELHGKQVSSGKESSTSSSQTITDSFSVSASVEASYGFASASLELGYEHSNEKTTSQQESVSSSETQTVELTTDLTQQVSSVLGREIVTTSSISETRTCTASCESRDDNQVVIWQWVFEQTDPNAKAATVHTCTFVCRSASFDAQPVCPGGQCLNNDCTTCKKGTFADPDVDRFYATERITNGSIEEGDRGDTGKINDGSNANEPSSTASPEERSQGSSGWRAVLCISPFLLQIFVTLATMIPVF